MQRDEVADRISQRHANSSANHRQHDRLGQKLGHDVTPAPANALSQTDLARALSDGYEHHIHHADAADNQ